MRCQKKNMNLSRAYDRFKVYDAGFYHGKQQVFSRESVSEKINWSESERCFSKWSPPAKTCSMRTEPILEAYLHHSPLAIPKSESVCTKCVKNPGPKKIRQDHHDDCALHQKHWCLVRLHMAAQWYVTCRQCFIGTQAATSLSSVTANLVPWPLAWSCGVSDAYKFPYSMAVCQARTISQESIIFWVRKPSSLPPIIMINFFSCPKSQKLVVYAETFGDTNVACDHHIGTIILAMIR